MVRIRFRRVGAKNQPSFRIVAADKESPRDGRFLEVLGSYNPRTEPSTLRVDEARLFHWMKNGAKPSDAVVQTLSSVGTWDRWERFKQGESLDSLVAEAEAAIPEVDPRTRREDRIGVRSKKRPKAEAAAAAEIPEPSEEESPEAEADESVEADVPPEPAEGDSLDAEADVSAEAQVDDSAGAEAGVPPEPAEGESPELAEGESPELAEGESLEAEAGDAETDESPEAGADEKE